MDTLENIPLIKYDNFLKSKYITWQSVGGRNEKFPEYNFGDSLITYFDNNRFEFIFSFIFYDNKIYFVLKFKPKQYKLRINDSVSFLFENNSLINLIVKNEPYKAGCYNEVGSNGFPDFYETLILLKITDLETFSTLKLTNFALNLKTYKLIGGQEKKGCRFWQSGSNFDSSRDNKEIFQVALIQYASDFLIVIKEEVPEYKEILNDTRNEVCFVYLMHDLNNNFYKIGISNQPKYREKTLQSEKPTIVLICSRQFPKRNIAEILEKTLHDTYSNKRIRGEWFALNFEDINDISQVLSE
jgi:hypothetical protein